MADFVAQLDSIRRQTRRLLVLMRLAAWVSALIGAALAAGVLDYVIHLPGAVRLVLGLLVILAAGVWGVHQIGRALRVHPGLASLALRLERLYPETAGRLATGVAFTVDPQQAGVSPISHVLAQRTAQDAESAMGPRQMRKLVNPRRPGWAAGLLVVSVVVMVGCFLMMPEASGIALRRWTMPLGDAAWPKRTMLESDTRLTNAPNDQPVPIRAVVTKGDRDGLRVWVKYRFVGDSEALSDRDWQRALLTRQSNAASAGSYQRLLEPESGAATVELYFEADDDRTERQRITLIEPPGLRQMRLQVEPPAYASDLVAIEARDLLQPPRPTVTVDALAGSTMTLAVQTNKVLPLPSVAEPTGLDDSDVAEFVQDTLGGLVSDFDAPTVEAMGIEFDPMPGQPTAWQIRWTQIQAVTVQLQLTDEHGLRHVDGRLFRFLVREDVGPQASVIEPPTDEQVLSTAVLAIGAEASDDVAVTHIQIDARAPDSEPQLLGEAAVRGPRARADAALELEPFALRPGQEMLVVATALDGFDLGGERHDPVESRPRRLMIISPETMAQQIRAEMMSIRQRALRAEAMQAELEASKTDAANAARQQRLSEQIGAMQQVAEQQAERMARNRLDDEALDRMVERSDELLEAAQEAAESAADAMQRAAEDQEQAAEAREDQRAVRDRLGELIDMLDQGRAAFRVRQQLGKLKSDQQKLLEQTEALKPRTLGQSPDQLSDDDRAAMEALAEAQRELAETAERLTDALRDTADRLTRQAESPSDEALAEALREAALIAQRQALSQKMRQAGASASQNQLSRAESNQASSLATIEEMLEQVNALDKKQQEMLRRQLEELVQAIERLVRQQTAQLGRLMAAVNYAGLDEPLLQLRRNTLAVAEQARQVGDQAEPVAMHLDGAAVHQQQGVEALRADPAMGDDATEAERAALDRLEQALALARELAEQAKQEEDEQRRKELTKAYEKALADQTEIAKETKVLIDEPDAERGRKWRIDSMDLGHRESELRLALQDIEALVADTVVFSAVHTEMDEWAERVTTVLDRAEAEPQTLLTEQLVISAIESLIEALKRDNPDNPFASEQNSGEGGGGGGEPRLIPPMAELKLLRERQKVLYRMTRELHAQGLLDQAGRDMLNELANQQRRLVETAETMAEALQRE